ncbi:MAG: SUMF1/EgtB/PvdO family nonheme iron enzyme [Myxococcales bacterium]|nr:SUMF1/EgtB/PvdO family nonheme iron enzyme [Myxococcales bacterium]
MPQRSAKIGPQLEALLRARGMTQEQLARKVGVHPRSVRRHLAGQPVRRDLLAYYAKVLGVSVETLTGTVASIAPVLPGASGDRELRRGYREWVVRAMGEVPYWPSIGMPRRPALGEVFVRPEIVDGPEALPDRELLGRRFVVLTGGPGSGKTTYLRALCASLAQDQGALLPVYVPVSELAAELRETTIGGLVDALRRLWAPLPIAELGDMLPSLFERDALVLLLDNLHDTARFTRDSHERVLGVLNTLPRDLPSSCRVLVSCRSAAFGAYGYALRPEYTRAELTMPGQEALTSIVSRLETLTGDAHLGWKLRRLLKRFPQLEVLAGSRLELTMLGLCVLGERQPATVTEVYDACLDAMLGRMEGRGWNRELTRRCLVGMASYAGKDRGARLGPIGVVRKLGGEQLAAVEHAARFVGDLDECVGVVAQCGDSIRFGHELWKDFLLAREIVGSLDDSELARWIGEALPSVHPELLRAVTTRLIEGGRAGALSVLCEGVGGLDPRADVVGAAPGLLSVLQALPREFSGRDAVAAAAVRALRPALPVLADPSGAGETAARRVVYAEALGVAGDPRKAHFLSVPAGPAFVRGGFCEVEAFSIMRDPVTVEHYQRFVREAQPYRDRGLWTEDGWQWAREHGSRRRGEVLAAPRSNRPVVGVSWYEADAYCRHLGGALPTSQMWEKAGRGGLHVDGRENPEPRRCHPWGSDFTGGGGLRPGLERLNCRYSRPSFGATTPVGCFPAGASPYGVCDMLGNVFEWLRDGREGSRRAFAAGGSFVGMRRTLTLDSTAVALDRRLSFMDVGFRCSREG